MIEVNIPAGISKVTVPTSLYQWDYGQILEITGDGIPSVCQVHFANKNSNEAIVRLASPINNGVSVPIPDALLEQEYDINAFIYVIDDEAGQTIKHVLIPLIKRKKPADYEEEIPVEFQSELEAMIANINAHLTDIEETRNEILDLYDNTITEDEFEELIKQEVENHNFAEAERLETKINEEAENLQAQLDKLKIYISRFHNDVPLELKAPSERLIFNGTGSKQITITTEPSTAVDYTELTYSIETLGGTDATFSISTSHNTVTIECTSLGTKAGTRVYRIYDVNNTLAYTHVYVEVVI